MESRGRRHSRPRRWATNQRNVPACNTNSRPRGCSLPAVAGSGHGSPPYYCCCASLSWPATSEAHSRSPQVCNKTRERNVRLLTSGPTESTFRVIVARKVVNCARASARYVTREGSSISSSIFRYITGGTRVYWLPNNVYDSLSSLFENILSTQIEFSKCKAV